MRYFTALMLGLGWAGQAIGAPSCSVSVPNMSFGNYAPLATTSAIATLGEVTVSCTRQFLQDIGTVNFTAVISAGSSGNFSARTLRGATDQLAYRLYRDAAGQTPWGAAGAAGSIPLPFLTLSGTSRLPVFGNLPARQNVRPGVYSDTLTVTVTY